MQGGEKHSKKLAEVSKNPEELTKSDAITLLEGCRNGYFRLDSYIPVIRTTPDIIIEKARGYLELQKLPMFMAVKKAQQMLEDEQENNDRSSRAHGIDEETASSIFKGMFSPDYIVYQKKNSRIAALIKHKGKTALVSIDSSRNINKDLTNGYEGSAYNIVVTLFNLDSLTSYLEDENNLILYKKSKANHEEAAGSFVPSLSNDSPYKDNIPHMNGDVNTNDMQNSSKNTDKENVNDSIEVQRKVFSKLQQNGFFTDDNKTGRTDVNQESGMEIETNKSGINETFSYKNFVVNGKETKILKLATVPVLPTIIKNARVIEDNVSNFKNTQSSVKYAYLMGSIRVDGIDYDVKITVRKSSEKNKFWVHHIYIKNDTDVASNETQKSESSALQTIDVEESVSQKPDDVNIKYSKQITQQTEDNIEQLALENEAVETLVDEARDNIPKLQKRLKWAKNMQAPSNKLFANSKVLNEVVLKHNYKHYKYSETEIFEYLEKIVNDENSGTLMSSFTAA